LRQPATQTVSSPSGLPSAWKFLSATASTYSFVPQPWVPYQAPPTISPPIIEFLDVATVNESPPPPGGPLQRFEFRATAPGTGLITFMPTQAGPAASDTVVVR